MKLAVIVMPAPDNLTWAADACSMDVSSGNTSGYCVDEHWEEIAGDGGAHAPIPNNLHSLSFVDDFGGDVLHVPVLGASTAIALLT